MIIDFHTHCFPDTLAPRAIDTLSKIGNIPPKTDGTTKALRTSMKEAGVELSILLPVATKPSQADTLNAWAASENREGVMSFGSVHPASPHWEMELDAVKANGLRGIKLHPDYQGFFADDPLVFPFYEKAISLGFIMVFHCGTDIGLPPPFHCMPNHLVKVVDMFPKANIVAAHMGAHRYWNEVEEILVGKTLYFDTAYSLHEMGKVQFLRMVRKHGAEKILFATDSPWANQKEYVQKLQLMGLSAQEIDGIGGNNAKALLGL